jgi:hypothetical protein
LHEKFGGFADETVARIKLAPHARAHKRVCTETA